jgi:hypothetical protein
MDDQFGDRFNAKQWLLPVAQSGQSGAMLLLGCHLVNGEELAEGRR